MTLRPRSDKHAFLFWSVFCVGAAHSAALAQDAKTPTPGVNVPQENKANPADKLVIRSSEVRVTEFGTCDIVVQNDDVTNVLSKLAVAARRNIVPSDGVQKTVNATLYGVTVEAALDGLLTPNGLGWEQNGDVIYVFTKDELAARRSSPNNLSSRRIHLDYLRPADAMEYAQPLLSPKGKITPTKDLGGDSGGGGSSAAGGAAGGSSNSGSSQSSDSGIYTPEKDEYALESAIVIHDVEENVERVESFLRSLDTQPEQVLIEATVLQVTLDEQNAFGVDFALLDGVQFSSFFGFPDTINGLGADGTTVKAPPVTNLNRNFVLSNPGNVAAGAGTLKLGITAGDDVGVFIRALDQITDVTLLSNPKVLALNRQRAKVLVGTRVGYLETTVVENQVLQTIKFIDTGVQLDIRPFVLKDGRVRMELAPKVSQVVFRDVESQNGVNQQIPDENIQTVLTDVLVPEGHTAILGGLFREDVSRSRSQVPWAGDLPLVGHAFEGQDDHLKRDEIIFMIKPTVMSENVLAQQGQEGLAYYERVRVGSRLGLLPWSREKMSAMFNLRAQKNASEGEYDWARFQLRCSLQLHPQQPEMIRLQEQLTDERYWPTRSMLERIVTGELDKDFPEARGAEVPAEEEMGVETPEEPAADEPASEPPAENPADAPPTTPPSNGAGNGGGTGGGAGTGGN